MRKYLLQPDLPDRRDFAFQSAGFAWVEHLPPLADLRGGCSPVVDQGTLGACTANAIVSGLREYLLLQQEPPLTPLSRLFLYYQERMLAGMVQVDSGARIRDGMKVLNTFGVCPENENPYDISKFAQPPTAREMAAAAQFKIKEYHCVGGLAMLKAAIAEGFPVVAGVRIYQSFGRVKGRFLDSLLHLSYSICGGARMPRHSRSLSESKIYHIMIRGNERRNIFLDDDDRLRFVHILYEKCADNQISIYAYCLMDNHVHLLINEGKDQVSRIMKRINVSYVYYFNKKYGRVGHLFQDRFKSEAIKNDQYLMAAVRYIHNNPVKAGIVDNPIQYKWSSYYLYIDQFGQENKIDKEYMLEIFSKNRKNAIQLFIEFSLMKDNETERFIEYQEEDSQVNKEIQTEQGAIEFIKKYALENNVDLDSLNHKSHNVLRTGIIKELKSRTSLSVRQIAGLLNIDRNIVQRVK
ncbi:Hypothetical protein LUCI_2026 [Lucifera butyrica]|uniref:Transposase IS200-like domain-containing protein n=1 Tax=Lucifera butyrica TaxID=1351585 RepID=A0A498R787_9FIRM|nr:transposase [Lucifera butyrica]VBB06790.1 Hypothetical protein LUCI_2026 [Lucifera butyrica]